MNARVVFRPFETDCGFGACMNGCSHRMWRCDDCSSEGGWGAPESQLRQMADAHNCIGGAA